MTDSLLSEHSLSQIRYNIFSLSGIPEAVERYPELSRLVPFIENFDVLKYMVLMYDKTSPFIRMHQDVNQRKQECAVMAGLDPSDEFTDSLFCFNDENFLAAVSEFLKIQNARLWAMVVSNEQTFDEYQKALLSEVVIAKDTKDKLNAILIKSKLMEDSDNISKRLDDYYRILFNEKEIIEYVSNKLTPEQIAKQKA